MASYKEIVTKAIIGKGKKYFKDSYDLQVEHTPSTVLGCWVINHKFKGYKTNDKIGVNGTYDVNIWYSYDNDSKTTVVNKKIDYNEVFNIKLKESAELTDDTDIIIRPLKQPTCSKVSADGNKISFDIEKEIGVEVVGDAKIKIAIEDDEDPWDEVDDEVNEKVEKEIDEGVNEGYIA